MLKLYCPHKRPKDCPIAISPYPTSLNCKKCDYNQGMAWVFGARGTWEEVSCGFDEKAHWGDTLEHLEKLPSLGRHQECPKDKNIKPTSHDCQECDFCKGLKRQENQILSGLSWQPKFVEYFVFCGFKNENSDKESIKESSPARMSQFLKNEIKTFGSKITDAEKSIEKLKDRCKYYSQILCEMQSKILQNEKDD